MIEINLVPDIKQTLIKAQRIRSTVISIAIFIGVGSIGIVAALAIYIYTVQTVRSALADSSIDSESKKLSDVKDLSKMLTIQNQLTKISALNADKKVDSRFFDLLTAIIPPAPNNVQITDLVVDSTAGTVTINGQAANSYAALEVFKKTIKGATLKFDKDQKKTLASSISITNTSYGEDISGAKVLRFTISFVYVPELFSPASKNVSISIPNKGNVTDSYLGIPFANRAKDLTGVK